MTRNGQGTRPVEKIRKRTRLKHQGHCHGYTPYEHKVGADEWRLVLRITHTAEETFGLAAVKEALGNALWDEFHNSANKTACKQVKKHIKRLYEAADTPMVK